MAEMVLIKLFSITYYKPSPILSNGLVMITVTVVVTQGGRVSESEKTP